MIWPEGKFNSAMAPNESLRHKFAKADQQELENKRNQEVLQKALPAMLKLLELRLLKSEPLKVVRPFSYQTSILQKSSGRFIDADYWFRGGETLLFKSLEVATNTFIFEDQTGATHEIPFGKKVDLVANTNIFDEVKHMLDMGVI